MASKWQLCGKLHTLDHGVSGGCRLSNSVHQGVHTFGGQLMAQITVRLVGLGITVGKLITFSDVTRSI